MKPGPLAAAVVVLGVAAWAGVGFAGCGGGGNADLVWLHPAGSGFPSTNPAIGCSETGGGTSKLGLTAWNLGPGDGCQFSASLHNTGDRWLRLGVQMHESTAHGDPTFASCFGFTLSSGPSSGKLAGGGSYPYTFTFDLLHSASKACENAVGTVSIQFTGSPD